MAWKRNYRFQEPNPEARKRLEVLATKAELADLDAAADALSISRSKFVMETLQARLDKLRLAGVLQ
jgi:uncharacterized protein (DUF1778 family)